MDKNKLKAVTNVVFEGNYISELGSDAGGPSREFFFLALTSCTQEMQSGGSMFFTGTANHLVPVHDWDLLEDEKFNSGWKDHWSFYDTWWDWLCWYVSRNC